MFPLNVKNYQQVNQESNLNCIKTLYINLGLPTSKVPSRPIYLWTNGTQKYMDLPIMFPNRN